MIARQKPSATGNKPLLHNKLMAPRLNSNVIHRGDPLSRLDQALGKTTGLDISKSLVEIARKNAAKACSKNESGTFDYYLSAYICSNLIIKTQKSSPLLYTHTLSTSICFSFCVVPRGNNFSHDGHCNFLWGSSANLESNRPVQTIKFTFSQAILQKPLTAFGLRGFAA
jgi:hypothetical protein